MERFLREHLRPALERERTRARSRDDQAGDWFTPEAIATLREAVGRPVRLDRAWLEKLTRQEAVRFFLKGIVEETIERFVENLTSVGGSSLIGSIGRGAVGLAANVSKAVLGSLAPQIESQIKGAASRFVASSLNLVLDRVVVMFSSKDAAEQMGHMNQVAFDAFLDLPTKKVVETAMKLPVDEVLSVLPGLVAHNLGRKPVRDAILAELRAALAVEGKKPLREIIGDEGAVAAWRAEVVRLAAPLLVEFAGSTAFASWLGGRSKPVRRS